MSSAKNPRPKDVVSQIEMKSHDSAKEEEVLMPVYVGRITVESRMFVEMTKQRSCIKAMGPLATEEDGAYKPRGLKH